MRSKTWQKWNQEEIKLLKKHWPTSTKNDLLLAFPNRGYISLMRMASQLGIKSNVHRQRKGSFEFLDYINKNSCYWWGFIMADGCITKKGRIDITLNNTDKNHLEKIAQKLHCNIRVYNRINYYTKKEDTMCNISVLDKTFVQKWLSTLKLNPPKTYNPPGNLSIFLTKQHLAYFFIGLIDGDGSIWLEKGIPKFKLELHYNWLQTLIIISENLKKFYNINFTVLVSKRGTAIMRCTSSEIKKLTKYAKEVDFLERKWSLCN